MADARCRIRAVQARGWPRWAWLLGVSWVKPNVRVDDVFQEAPWFHPAWVPLATQPATVTFSYNSKGWPFGGKASVEVMANDDVVYTPPMLPWMRGHAVVVGAAPPDDRAPSLGSG
ncbi:MAG: hypothetical protein JWO68_877 [Actinomycetia bacterium]|nr:hypothetical protein [Actinomycetes bacterium]